MKELAEFVRAMVRPVVTFALVGAAIYFLAQTIDVPEWMRSIIAVVIGFWFGSRAPVKATP